MIIYIIGFVVVVGPLLAPHFYLYLDAKKKDAVAIAPKKPANAVAISV